MCKRRSHRLTGKLPMFMETSSRQLLVRMTRASRLTRRTNQFLSDKLRTTGVQ